MKKLSNPEPRDLCISDCNEKALQRAMLKQSIDGNLSNLDDGTSIEWIDYELPVEFTNNSRKQSIDLIGRDNNGRFVLCEAKYNCNKKDSPHDAELEALSYLGKICLHLKELYENNIHRPYVYINDKSNSFKLPDFSWIDFINSHPRVLIMADVEYWNYWRGRKYRQLHNKNKKDKKSIQVKDPMVECYSINIECNYFEKQLKASGNSMYTPELSVNYWDKIKI